MRSRRLPVHATLSALLIFLLITSSIAVAAPVSTDYSGTVRGSLTQQYEQNWLGVRPDHRNATMTFTVEFQPADSGPLKQNFGFWVLSESDLRAVLNGGSFIGNNVAAGEKDGFQPDNILKASVAVWGLSSYTVVIYNNSTVPAYYNLSVDNGIIQDNSNQVESIDGPAQVTFSNLQANNNDITDVPEVIETSTVVQQVSNISVNSTYVVRPGDTMVAIALGAYDDSDYAIELCEFNAITNCNFLVTGQQLEIPTLFRLSQGPGSSASVFTPTPSAEDTLYTVKPGDSLSLIARENYGIMTLFSDLCAYNGLLNCNLLQVGDQIYLPAREVLTGTPGGTATTPTVAETASTETGTTSSTTASTATGTTSSTTAPVATTSTTTSIAESTGSVAVATQNLYAALQTESNIVAFSLLLDAVDIDESLDGTQTYTILAPSNISFAGLLPGTLAALLSDPVQLAKVLNYHIVPGKYSADALAKLGSVRTMTGDTIVISRDDQGTTRINGAHIISADIPATNGLIQVIDTVLLPPTS